MAWLLVAVSLVLVAACGAFVAAEFALITVDRATVERAADSGDRRALKLRAAFRNLSTQLSGAQLGITITNLAIGFLAEPAVATLLHSPLRAVGLPDGAISAVAVIIALILATAFTMIFGELVPKNLAIAMPLATARALAGFQRGFTTVMAYPIRLLNGTANWILRRVGVEPQEELASARSPEELSSLLARSAELGTLPSETATLLQRSLTFGDKEAGDVLTPRFRLRSIPVNASVSAVIEAAKRTGHSRFPVTGEGVDGAAEGSLHDPDNIVGLVHIKHAVIVPEDERDEALVGSVMVPAQLVPSSLHLDPLLDVLRKAPLQMVLVVDEFGGTAGVVTIEDLVEELVGEVADEHDRYGPQVRHRRDGSWTLSGLLRVDEVTAATSVPIPEHRGYDTIGGLIIQRLGRLAVVGDVVELPFARLTVTQVAGRRVDRLRLEPHDSSAEESADADAARAEGR
jgi:CBS domain containing-hemolysin-like protein